MGNSKNATLSNMNAANKKSGIIFIPFLVFLAIYISSGVYHLRQGVDFPFSKFPSAAAMFIALVIAFILNKTVYKHSVDESFSIFASGAGSESTIMMVMIYLLAGAFSTLCTEIGARDSVVNFCLSFMPVKFATAGMFVIAGLMSIATGTSAGSIAALLPIGAPLAQACGINIYMMTGAIISGAMVGDNLSMISDTTIAATKTQGVEMKDKFRMNAMIALPAAIITLILFLCFGAPKDVTAVEIGEYSFIKIIPYIVILVLSLCGLNVFMAMVCGIFTVTVIAFATGSLTIPGFASTVWSGFTGMDQSTFMTILTTGLTALVAFNGGINWLTSRMRSSMKTHKGAQVGIAAMTALIDMSVANNTVAIIVTGPIAKEVSQKYKIDPRRTASLLDVFACSTQALLPYCGQILQATGIIAVALEGMSVSPLSFIPYVWYCPLLALFAIISIFVPFADGVTKKDPWNWEYNCPESKVEEVKATLEAVKVEATPAE